MTIYDEVFWTSQRLEPDPQAVKKWAEAKAEAFFATERSRSPGLAEENPIAIANRMVSEIRRMEAEARRAKVTDDERAAAKKRMGMLQRTVAAAREARAKGRTGQQAVAKFEQLMGTRQGSQPEGSSK